MRNLTEVSIEEQQSFLDSFDQILCDIDGVLWLMPQKLEGTADAIQGLRHLGKKIVFITNNSTKPHQYLFNELQSGGFGLETEEDLIIPSLAMISYLKSVNFSKEIYVIGMKAIKGDLKRAGFTIANESPHQGRISETLVGLLEHLKDNEDIGAVVVDMDLNQNYLELQKAAIYLKRSDVIFITGGSDAKVPIGSNLLIIGPRFYQNVLEEISGRKSLKIAKPSVDYNKYIMEKFHFVDSSRVLFIGDSVPEDMGFATNCGYKKLLVLSGITRKEHLRDWSWPEEYKPNYYVDSLKDVYEVMKNIPGNKL